MLPLVCIQTINRDPVMSQLQLLLLAGAVGAGRAGLGHFPGLPSSTAHGATCTVIEWFGSEGAVKGLALLRFPLCNGPSIHFAKFGIALS